MVCWFVFGVSIKPLLKKIARGNCILKYHSGNSNKPVYDMIVYALRKFTGGLGDEDDMDRSSNKDWAKYFLRELAETRRVVTLRKANGEAAHMSCRYINEQFFICAGSKNVHLLFQKKSLPFSVPKKKFSNVSIINIFLYRRHWKIHTGAIFSCENYCRNYS